MKAFQKIFCSALVAGILALLPASVPAQTNRIAISPPIPVLRSPVDSFRSLLVMPNAERKEQLATRSTEVQQRLVEKIREYQGLTPDERELRLKATELQWFLKPLMTSSPTNRARQLALIPEGMREMVAVRIEQWDRLPPAIQQMMLTNQHGSTYIASVDPKIPIMPKPAEQIRMRLQQRFNRLFDLTAEEKEKVLASLSDAERKQMEKTLESFKILSPSQKRHCVNSFTKFAGMNATERQEFLKNAERWSQMSPADRQAWRELVSIAPKLPPLPVITIKRPPLPTNPNKPAGAMTTNGG